MTEGQPRVIDYGESTYRQDFWEKGREYEDRAERIALRRLLPSSGARILEIGAGFGRLAPLYGGFRETVLLDYSRPLLVDARVRLGDRPIYTCANWYALPFADGAFDAILTVRVLHHAEDLPRLFGEISRVLAPGGAFILEFANKRNLKAILRWALGRQAWNPFQPAPIEFYPLHWDFHPSYVSALLARLGMSVEVALAVSWFRAALLKRAIPPSALARLDGSLQRLGGRWPLTPSVFLRARKGGQAAAVAQALFRCPECARTVSLGGAGQCRHCGAGWPIVEGIHDFRVDCGSCGASVADPCDRTIPSAWAE